MVEFVSEVTAAVRLGVFVANYNSYRYGKRKEDDMAIRRRIMEEVDKAKEHCLNMLELAYRTNNVAVEMELKGVMDNLDLFRNEVQLAEVGYKYPFFSEQKSTKMKQLKKLVEYDATILETTHQATQQITLVEQAMASGGSEALPGIRHAKGAITSARDVFRNRIAIIKGAKEV